MKSICIYFFWLLSLLSFSGCTKTSFLDAKPNTSIIVPSSLADLRALLSNTYLFSYSPGIGEVSADDYFLYPADWNALPAIERNLHVWAKDLYGAQRQLDDWGIPNQQILYTNIVLEQWQQIHPSVTDSVEWKDIKGSALFQRAYAMSNLLFHFAPGYDSVTAGGVDGIPIRLSTDIHAINQRSKLQTCVDQVISDAKQSLRWLQFASPIREKNRPSRAAACALLARIYLYCHGYEMAGKMADSALALYNKLIDYNTVSTTATTPFDRYNDESIYFSQVVSSLNVTLTYSNVVFADSNLYRSYSINDIRRQLYYRPIGSSGNVGFKRGYSGTVFPFTGLTTDELYLIRAESAAKTGNVSAALGDLNTLLAKRWKTGTFTAFQVNTSQDVITLIRTERRKELVWRGIRWLDLKRYNLEGAGISLSRQLGANIYMLPANSPRFVFPFPDDETNLSGIIQNGR